MDYSLTLGGGSLAQRETLSRPTGRLSAATAIAWRWLVRNGDMPLFIASLLAKTIAFAWVTGLGVGVWAPWVTIFLLAALAGLLAIGPRMVRRAGLFLLSLTLTLLVLADVVQMRFTNDVITVPAIQQAGQLLDVMAAVKEYLYLGDLWFFIDVPLWLAVFVLGWRVRVPAESRPRRRISNWLARLALLPAGGLLFSMSYASAKSSNPLPFDAAVSTRQQVETLGILGFHAHDIYTNFVEAIWPTPLETSEIDEIYEWFDRRRNTGPELVPFGIAKGKNVIVLQIESLQDFVIGLEVNGQEVTPNLNRLRRESVYFSRCFDQTHNGRSSDCDFCCMVSQHPAPGAGAVVYQYAHNDFPGVADELRNRGYTTFSACSFWETYWNMTEMHQKYGFRKHLFRIDGNGRYRHQVDIKYLVEDEMLARDWISDRTFLRQTLAEIKTLEQPFLVLAMTIISHAPYDFIPLAEHELDLPNPLRPPQIAIGRYLQHVRWVDRAIGEFFQGLKQAGLYDDSLIVLIGDHDGGLPDDDFRLLGRIVGEDWNPYLMDRVPLFFRLPRGQHAGDRTTTTGHLDVAPSICHLMGIPRGGTFYLGHNLFCDNGNAVVPFRTGSFADQHYLYRNVGASFETGECFDLRTGELVDPACCRQSYEEAIYRLSLSDRVQKHNLIPTFQQMWRQRHPRPGR